MLKRKQHVLKQKPRLKVVVAVAVVVDVVAMLAVVIYLYQLITYSLNGRTFGMAICGLRCAVMEEVSQPISFKRRLWQAFGGTVALLCPPLNFFVTRVTEHQRGLADALAGTITLRRTQD